MQDSGQIAFVTANMFVDELNVAWRCLRCSRSSGTPLHPGATRNVLYGPANLCAADRFELGRCEAMLNALGARGWKLVGASLNYSIIFFIRE